MTYDIYLVGVGGQGVLTIGEILAEAAMLKGIPANFYPTKGMAQRGGFVKAQLRLGRALVGPNIPEKGADLVISMEVSESLKAVRFIKPGGDFVLFGHVWAPTAVMLGKAEYPSLHQVCEQIQLAGGRLLYLDPARLPEFEGTPVPDNIYTLGAAVAHSRLRELLDVGTLRQVIATRWKKGSQRNLMALQAGFEAGGEMPA